MSLSFRQSVLVTTAIIGLTAMSALAAPPGAKDPTQTGTPPAAGASEQQSGTASEPAAASTDAQSGDADSAQSMEARVEQRINDLHAKLQITPGQEADWKKFAETMRDNAKKMDQTFESRIQQIQSMNALDNMRSYARISQQHARDVQALLPPFQALYGKMSQSQKQTADAVFREDANRGQAQHG